MLQLITLSVEDLSAIVKQSVSEVMGQLKPSKEDSEIMTIDQAEEFLKIKKSSIYKLCAEGAIPHYKPGKNLLFNRAELKTWLEGFKK